MNKCHAAVLLLIWVTTGIALHAVSQSPNAKQEIAPVPQEAFSRPRNLKVLPNSISGEDLKKLMHEYEQGLGVPCGYCHAQDAQTKQIDYASDENPIKQTARVMIAMTGDINTKYLAQLGDRRYATPVTCGNCHQGQATPPDFEPKPQN